RRSVALVSRLRDGRDPHPVLPQLCGWSPPCSPTAASDRNSMIAAPPARENHASMPQIKTPLTQAIAEYLVRHSRQDEVMARVARDTEKMPDSEMMSPPDEAALITMLARLVGATQALEVGTFTGYGAIAIARGLADG